MGDMTGSNLVFASNSWQLFVNAFVLVLIKKKENHHSSYYDSDSKISRIKQAKCSLLSFGRRRSHSKVCKGKESHRSYTELLKYN